MSTLQDVLTAAQLLPAAERVQLIHALWDAMPPEEWAAPTDEWLTEAARRSDALEASEMTATPWSEARERARRQAGLDG